MKIKDLIVEYKKQVSEFADLIEDYKSNNDFQKAHNARIRMATMNLVIEDLEKLRLNKHLLWKTK